jgi:ABC-type branched-subunit amino acid transport system substrate-binding protein
MRFTRRFSRAASTIVVLGTVVVLLGATLGGVSSAGTQAPKADDIGITSKEIRLAVVADVDNALVPGLFQNSVDGMRAWAKWINKQGGIAGRKVVIDFIDSRLSADDARNAVIQACAEDFAMVGGQALFLNNVDDMVACPNKQGQPVGLPNLPGLALDPAEKCAPVTYLATGDQQSCATLDQNPQTYYPQQGDFIYYLQQQKKLHGIFVVPNDLKATRDAVIPQVQSAVDLGIKDDAGEFINTSASSLQSAITPAIKIVKDQSSSFVYNGNAPNIMVFLRKEAKLQGVDSVKFWACNQGCYDKESFLVPGGADVEDTYAVTYTLPFYSEYKSNPTMKALVNQLGGPDKMNANGVASWVAALLFQDAVAKTVAGGATLDRETLLETIKGIHDFDADGIIGTTDIGNKKLSPCLVMSQVQNGAWKRVFPKKVGSFDCNPKNVNKLELDL